MPAKKTDTILVAAKPFLKWAGGKRQLLQHFSSLYPADLKLGRIKNYYEPFAGSGAVFFDIARHFTIENAYLSDVNPDLVLTYKMIRAHVSKLTAFLDDHQKKYLAFDKKGRHAYFYEQRSLFNRHRFEGTVTGKTDQSIARAAQLIFLNRTCFNGLFRVNSKGLFNTPAGDYSKPCICDEANLRAVSGLLAGVTIKRADFTRALKDIKPHSFVYFDPPYRPLSASAHFTAYSKTAFTDTQQRQLARVCKDLDKKGVSIMLSNSDTGDGFFDNLYRGFHLMRVPAKRLINADASKRGYISEIVVTNYKV